MALSPERGVNPDDEALDQEPIDTWHCKSPGKQQVRQRVSDPVKKAFIVSLTVHGKKVFVSIMRPLG